MRISHQIKNKNGTLSKHPVTMKFLRLTLWQGEVCTDNDDANTNDDRQSMIV